MEPVEQIAESGRTRADEIREVWQSSGQDPAALIEAISYPEFSC